jgi:hypothetical protein
LDGGGLSPEIKRTFFELFEQYKQVDLSHYWSQPLSEIVERLYQIPSLKSQNTVQFSFATKLLNTLNNRIPIYDSEVKMVFGFADAYSTDYKKRVERLLSYHQVISDTYSIINRDNLLGLTLDKLDSKFPMYTHIPEIKKLDFVFWAAGKLMRSTSKN